MTKRAHRNSDGNLVVNNVTQSSHMKYFEGSRAQVFNGTAYQTSGGLQKKDLIQLKSRRIVSKKKHISAKHENRLAKYGWTAKKGKFGAVRIEGRSRSRSRHSRSRRHYGGVLPP